MSSSNRYLKKIEQAAGDKPPVPDVRQIAQTNKANIPLRTGLPGQFSNTGLVIDRELTEVEWLNLVERIETIRAAYQWILGDWLVYGVKRLYGETDAQMEHVMELTGKSRTSLQDYHKTARLFEINERSLICNFEIHRVLATAFSDDTLEHKAARLAWLKVAEEQKLSGRKLSAEIAKAQLPATVDNDLSPAEDITSPALSDNIEDDGQQLAPSLPPSLKDENIPREFKSVWKKVYDDTVTQEDVSRLVFLRMWCDEAIQNANRMLAQARKARK